MLSGQRLRWFVRAVTHRPLHTVVVVPALALGGVLASRLEPSGAFGLCDLIPLPWLRQLAVLRAVGSRPLGADA